MVKFPLVKAFSESIARNVLEMISDIGEVGLDSFISNGVLKDIPMISTAISLFQMGVSVRDKHYVRKLEQFIYEINIGIEDETKRREYIEKFNHDEKTREQELEYLLVVLDRYVGLDKPRFLARIFLAYLDKKISWGKVCQYAEVLDRFLPGDYEVLSSSNTYRTEKDENTDVLQRLIALGLVIEDIRKSKAISEGGTITIDPPAIMEQKERLYTRVEFGDVLVGIVEK